MPHIELIICLGSHAMRWHLGEAYPGSVDAAVRNWRAGLALEPAVVALPHPSWRNSGWLKRNPWFAAETLPELRARVAAALKRAA
jgi:uracil-DNA glycosylase